MLQDIGGLVHWLQFQFQFELEYQKGTDNGATDALSWVPISHSQETIQSLLEGAIVGATNRSEAKASEELLEEHEHLSLKTAECQQLNFVGFLVFVMSEVCAGLGELS